MDDTFRLDLAEYDKEYIHDVLSTFLGRAGDYGRRLIEIRMSKAMFDRLEIEKDAVGSRFRGVPVSVCDTGFEGTIEVILSPLH